MGQGSAASVLRANISRQNTKLPVGSHALQLDIREGRHKSSDVSK